jgi:CubicO group peptidase (beta-lactamase class C family)
MTVSFAAIFAAVGMTVTLAQEKAPDVSEKSPSHGGRGPGGPPPGMLRPEPFPEAREIAPPKNEVELAAAIVKLGDEVAGSGRFSGAVLLAVDDKPLVEEAWGLADRAKNIPNTAQTSFDVASLGKLFTQVAIVQLLEAGKLSLDEPFGKYLADYPNHDVAAKITLRLLLLHTSGMGDIADPATREAKARSLRSLKDFLPLFASEPLAFAPGSEMRYSNAGYVVLGRVVEQVAGEDYFQYVEHHILTPAGMKHAGFFDRTNLPATVARSYDGAVDVTQKHPVRGSPAGGLQASVEDLLRLVQAIDSGKLVKKESVKLLRDLVPRPPNAPQPADPNKFVGYGIAGGAEGVNAQLNIDPTGRFVRIVLCNSSPPMASSMAATIGDWLIQLSK